MQSISGQVMNMIRNGVWLAATALGAWLPAHVVMAADLPVKAKPIVAATFDWSGVYAGVHAGFGGGATDWAQGGGLVHSGYVGAASAERPAVARKLGHCHALAHAVDTSSAK